MNKAQLERLERRVPSPPAPRVEGQLRWPGYNDPDDHTKFTGITQPPEEQLKFVDTDGNIWAKNFDGSPLYWGRLEDS